jgi:hypothetical protein
VASASGAAAHLSEGLAEVFRRAGAGRDLPGREAPETVRCVNPSLVTKEVSHVGTEAKE